MRSGRRGRKRRIAGEGIAGESIAGEERLVDDAAGTRQSRPALDWLFLHSLDSVAKVRKFVEFYVAEHNTQLPHSAFKGQTPDEMYFGTGDAIPEQLAVARSRAREARLERNRAQHCAVCV